MTTNYTEGLVNPERLGVGSPREDANGWHVSLRAQISSVQPAGRRWRRRAVNYRFDCGSVTAPTSADVRSRTRCALNNILRSGALLVIGWNFAAASSDAVSQGGGERERFPPSQHLRQGAVYHHPGLAFIGAASQMLQVGLAKGRMSTQKNEIARSPRSRLAT